MNIIDLFSGIGGFHIGLEMAGFEFDWVAFSEIEDYPAKVYKKRFPNAEFIGDIRKIDGTKYTGEIDIITGGFPCQDISYAGKGVGIHGSRSGLWKEMFRLICEIRPRYVIVENVPALLGRGLGVVLGDLAQGGYDAEWDCIPASAVGAPHRRDRIWIVAYPCGKRRQQDTGSASGNEKTDERWTSQNNHKFECDGQGNRKENVADSENSDRWRSDEEEYPGGRHQKVGRCRLSGDWSQYWSIEPDMGRVAYGVQNRMDRLKCLGNAVVPQVVAWIGQRLLEADSQLCASKS